MAGGKSICELCGHPMPEGEEMFKFHGYSSSCPEKPEPSFAIKTFKSALSTISYSRAGRDYDLSRERRQLERQQEAAALAKARAIWAENPDLHGDLRNAFKEASPLATMSEIDAA